MSDKPAKHTWGFSARFRRGAFGWRSDAAIARIKEALSEIKAAARKDARLGAEGAVLLLRKLSPALENIDSSSGAIGSAVNRAIEALVPLIAQAPADPATRRKWLELLYEAHADDGVAYIQGLADYWGELCATPDLAAEWADRLVGTVETIWNGCRAGQGHGFFHGTPMCLSALFAAGRHDQLLGLLDTAPYRYWANHRWGVKALVALGRKAEALRYAEETRGMNEPSWQIAAACEEILLSSGLADEAYRRYGLAANQAGTYLATFRALCRKYPHKAPADVLNDLVVSTPGQEGKWFAAAKDAGMYAVALQLARQSPVDHRTLIRAARDSAETEPAFALNCGINALRWICAGYGYDVTVGEVLEAYGHIVRAADLAQCHREALVEVRAVIESFPNERFVRAALASKKDLWSANGLAISPVRES